MLEWKSHNHTIRIVRNVHSNISAIYLLWSINQSMLFGRLSLFVPRCIPQYHASLGLYNFQHITLLQNTEKTHTQTTCIRLVYTITQTVGSVAIAWWWRYRQPAFFFACFCFYTILDCCKNYKCAAFVVCVWVEQCWTGAILVSNMLRTIGTPQQICNTEMEIRSVG